MGKGWFYGRLSAQQLAILTHQEDPWRRARLGLAPWERGKTVIAPAAMYEYYETLAARASE